MISIPKSEYARRRKALMAQMESSVVGDCDHPTSIATALRGLIDLKPTRRDISGTSRQERTAEFATILKQFKPAAAR